jgi:hypothetical protein
MAQPSTIYKPGKLNYVWNYLSSTLANFKAKLLGYRSYTALLTQTGTNPPVVTVLENNLGKDIVWTYSSVGTYTGTLVGAFVEQSKVAVITSQTDLTDTGVTTAFRASDDTIIVATFNYTGAPLDGLLSDSLVEVRVYN